MTDVAIWDRLGPRVLCYYGNEHPAEKNEWAKMNAAKVTLFCAEGEQDKESPDRV